MGLIARQLLGLAVGAVAMTGLSLAASAGVIDFEGSFYSEGDNLAGTTGNLITGSSITFGVTVAQPSSGSNAGTALIFNTQSLPPGSNDTDLLQPFDDPTTPGNDNFDPGNILVIGNNNGKIDDDADGGTITFTFSEAVNFLSVDLFDTGDGNQSPGVSNSVDITLLDAGGGTVGEFLNVGANLNDREFSTFTLSGIGNFAPVDCIQRKRFSR